MPETYGTRPLSFYASCAPDKLWGEDEEDEDMNAALREKWDEAEANHGKRVDIGEIVVCDSCDKDYTERNESGGFIFSSSAYCPACEGKALLRIRGYGEERFIKATCPDGMSFADFVRSYRGGNNTICINDLDAARDEEGIEEAGDLIEEGKDV